MTQRGATWHWERFMEFALYEVAAGGPDPHMRYVGSWARSLPPEEARWLGALYISVYNSPTTEVLYQQWPWVRAKADARDDLGPWLADHWAGLTLRRERRAVRTPGKLTANLHSLRRWLAVEAPRVWGQCHSMTPEAAYEMVWAEVMGLVGMGRYASFKVIEFWRRYCGLAVAMPDMRPRDGYSPRLTLGLLYPERALAIDAHRNTPAALALSAHLSDLVMAALVSRLRLPIDRYLTEVFLCDYRQSVEGERQYPGRSVDSEFTYFAKIEPHWPGRVTEFWTTRLTLGPRETLAEVGGWGGVRKPLGTVLAQHGYTWSDLLFAYDPDGDLASPKARERKDLHSLATANLLAG